MSRKCRAFVVVSQIKKLNFCRKKIMKEFNIRHLLLTGIWIPIIFWTTTIICGILLQDYNHLTRMVSELGELGTKTQLLFTVGLTLCGVLCIPFVIGLYGLIKKTWLLKQGFIYCYVGY